MGGGKSHLIWGAQPGVMRALNLGAIKYPWGAAMDGDGIWDTDGYGDETMTNYTDGYGGRRDNDQLT